MLPNFLVCGAQKAGTTSLYWFLRQHPQIFLPDCKETNYFSLNWNEPLQWYEEFFDAWSGELAVGEVSPLYLWTEEASNRIAKTLIDPRLIFLLRNPIDRAYSNYWFNISRGAQDPCHSFSDVIRNPNGENIYLSKGLYFRQLQQFTSIFPMRHLLVVFTEDLLSEPSKCLAEVFRFLGVDPSFQVSDDVNQNVTRLPRGPVITRAWSMWLQCRKVVSRLVPPQIAAISRQTRRRIHNQLFVEQSPPSMSSTDRDFLTKWFARDVEDLERMLEERSPWKRDFGCSPPTI